MTKNPVLLDSNLKESEILYPTKASLTLNLVGVDECNLSLPENSPEIGIHAWVSVYNHKGFVGIFRATSGAGSSPEDSVRLRHGIDILSDSIWKEEKEFSGTVRQFLTQLLAQQDNLINGVKPWALGTVADSSTITRSINYEPLLEHLSSLEDEGGDYYFSYDQTSFPWTINYLHRPTAVSSEFRLDRNLNKYRISENDSELCNRLILSVNAMGPDAATGTDQNKTVVRTYNNLGSQAMRHEIITRHEDIDTNDTLPNGPFTEADAYAAKYLAQREYPILQISIDGRELVKQTGETWDESRIGDLCRVAIPKRGISVEQRVFSVNYPDLFTDTVSISLANAIPKATTDIKRMGSAISRNSARGRSSARVEKNFIKHFEITDDFGNILKQAGMQLDADGLLVYADDNVNMVGSKFNVQADQIGMVVEVRDGQNVIKSGEIWVGIDNTLRATHAKIRADIIDIDGIVNNLDAYTVNVGGLVCEGQANFYDSAYFDSGIEAEAVTAGSFTVYDGENVAELTISDITKSADGKTLTITYADGREPVTFSKAVTLNGVWSNGIYTVTPSAGNPISTEIVYLQNYGEITNNSNGTISQKMDILYAGEGEQMYSIGRQLTVVMNASGAKNPVSMPNAQIYTTSGTPPGDRKTALESAIRQAIADGDSVVFRIDCGGTRQYFNCQF